MTNLSPKQQRALRRLDKMIKTIDNGLDVQDVFHDIMCDDCDNANQFLDKIDSGTYGR